MMACISFEANKIDGKYVCLDCGELVESFAVHLGNCRWRESVNHENIRIARDTPMNRMLREDFAREFRKRIEAMGSVIRDAMREKE